MTNTPRIKKNDYDGDGMIINAALSGISYGLGLYSLTQKPSDRPTWMIGSGFFWLMGFCESFNTSTWSCLSNVDDSQDAIHDLNRMVKAAPQHSIKISNYHYEEIKNKESGKIVRTRINTGGETANFNIMRWTD